MTDETRLEAAHRGGHEDGAHGVQALNGQSSPAEILMALEDAVSDSAEECKGAFWKGVLAAAARGMVFLFSDKQAEESAFVIARAYGVAQSLFPSLLDGLSAEELEGIQGAARLAHGRMPMAELIDFEQAAEEYAEGEESLRGAFLEGAQEGLRRFWGFFFVDGHPGRPEHVGRRIYAVAKSYFEQLIDGMSLEKMGAAFGEGNSKAARARWSWRVRSMVNRVVAAAGGVAHARFQKREETCRKYAAAARRTRNRAKKKVANV